MKNDTTSKRDGTRRDARAQRKWVGGNWIRQEKRLAIYLRDGLACVYCARSVEDGVMLQLDHLTPHYFGGCNKAWNLVTACERCNKSRGIRTVRQFCKAIGASEKHVLGCAKRELRMDEAKKMVARRGTAARAIEAELKKEKSQ